LLDKHTPGKTHRDWNISYGELKRMVTLGLFTEQDLEELITKKYKTGFVEFASTETPTRLYLDEVLDCVVESDLILGKVMAIIAQNPQNLILEKTTFKRCFVQPDGIVVEVESRQGELLYYKAKVLVDVMGVMSPIAMELNQGMPQTHICPTVGTVASGLENVDYNIGEILVSTEPADTSAGSGRQLIWEGFPTSDSEITTYLFFYDRILSDNDKSLLNLFETYFQKLPQYKEPGPDFDVKKLVYGIIPAYHHSGTQKSRQTAHDRILLLGDSATLSSPLTFCGFGSMVRNLERTASNLNICLNSDRFAKTDLDKISPFEPNVAIMSNLMKFMCFNHRTDDANFVNDLMNEIMKVLDGLPPRYAVSMFRDEMSLTDFNKLILTVGKKYPKIFEITFRKLGVSGSMSWLQNWLGWSLNPQERVA
jgi:lycopene cyclase CruA